MKKLLLFVIACALGLFGTVNAQEESTGSVCVVDVILTDSYGDGWNGNKLEVVYGATSKTIEFPNGATMTETMEIPSGTHVTVTYQKIGSYPEENSFVVAYESGEEILNVAKGSLSATTSWEFDVDCTPKAPGAPTIKAEATGGSSLVVTWNVVPTATSYKVYKGTEVVATVTETSYTVEGLEANTEYCYAVSAVNEIGESELSEAACATTFAEGTVLVSIGEGAISNFSAPIYNIGGTVYSLSQQIYTYDEMGYNGGYADIHAISFYKLSGDNNNRNIVVYLQNVEKETYTNNSDWVEFSDEDIVFEGEFNFGVAGEWVTITLPTPFEYTGGNLALTVYDKTGTGYGYDYTKCDKVASSSVAAWRGLYVTKAEVMDLSQLSAYYGTAMKTSSYETPANSYFVNNVKFRTMPIEGDPILDAPTGLAATANNHSSITLTWNAIEGANRYNVYSGTEKIASVKDAEYTYAGLEAETEYCFTVTAINSGGESEHSAEACATTEVFEGCNVNFTLTDQYNDGWDGCYLVVEYDGLTEQFNCPSGASPKTYTLPISHGSTVVVTYTKSSNYPQEKGIIVTYESGKEILNVAQGLLSATTSWEFVVDCTPAVPETPVLAAEVKGDKTIVLTMDAVGAESFNIYLNGELYIEGVTENVYTVEGLEPETEYCFTVEAVNEVGTSESHSEVACATTYKAGTSVVQIGEGTNQMVMTSPIYEFFANSISQTVYTADEIGFDSGLIRSIAYHKASGGNNDRNISIYMKNVNEANLATAWEPLTADLCVYDGYYNFGTTGWVEIALQEPFVYTGGDLLVCVLDKTGAYANIQDNFYTYITGMPLRSIYYGYSQTIDPLNITLGKNSLYDNSYNCIAPQAKFVIEPYEGGETPDDPVVDGYRLESIAGVYSYVYEEGTNKVTEVREGVYNEEYGSQYVKLLSYDANGLLTKSERVFLWEDTPDYSNEWTINSFNYTDGVLTSYTEEEWKHWYSDDEPYDVTEYALTYNAQGQLETITEGERTITFEYDAEGRLVKKEKTYYFTWDEPRVYYVDYSYEYVYDENGNCISETDYAIVEGEKTVKSVKEYFYNETIAAEDVYAFAFPYEVKPAQANALTKTVAYSANPTSQYDFTLETYVYNPEIASEPLAPVALKAEAISNSEIELSWVALEETEKFIVYKNGEFYTETEETALTVTGLTVATEYCFTVVGVNGDEQTPVSNEACATTLGTLVAPAAPVATVTAVTETTITLTWEAVEGATSYNVYVNEAEAVNVEKTTYKATGLTAATEYCFVVTALNGELESEKPEAVCATTEEQAELPENVVVIGEGESFATHIPFELCNVGFNEYTNSSFYGVSQQLYTAEEIAKEAGYIKSYALKFAGPMTDMSFETPAEQEDVVVDFEIYVQNTDLTVLQEGYEQASSQAVLAKDLYYAGKTTLENGEWTTFEFDYPFEYKGGNILVTIFCLDVENGKANFYPFYVYGTESIQSIQCSTDQLPTADNTITSMNGYWTKNQIQLTFTEEGEIIPEKPKAYRLESVESTANTSYVYDEVYTNRVVSMVKENITSVFTYNEDGTIATIVDSGETVDEEGNPTVEVINTVTYEYNEDGTLAAYTEETAGWAPNAAEFVYEDGKLVKEVNADYELEITYTYNAEGLVSEKVYAYGGELDSKEVYEYNAAGKLVEFEYYYYDAWDLQDYYLAEGISYTYNANGNCTFEKSYQVTEEGKFYFYTEENFYDATVAADDVFSFELPHVAATSVVPANANILAKTLSFYTERTDNGDINHTYNMAVYNYNPAVVLAPVTPMNLVAEVVNGTVELTWEVFADAETYTVFQDGEVIAEGLEEGSFTVENLKAGEEYGFAVRAYNSVGGSPVAEEVYVTIEENAPAAPVVTVKEVTETTIVLEWAAVEGAVDYILYFGTQALGNTEGETIAGVQGLEPETEYCFTVTAVNADGVESEHSEEVCATTKSEGIAENTATFNIYPNPVVDRLVIETEATVEEVTIYTVTGVMIYSEVDFDNNEINVSDFANGVYIMKVRTENGEAVQRFIKK